MPRFPGEVTVSLAEGSQEAILVAAAEAAAGELAAGLFAPGMGPFPLAELVGGESPALAREVEMPTDKELRGLTRTLRQSRDLIKLLIVRLNDLARAYALSREKIALRCDTFAKGSSQRSRNIGVGTDVGKDATGEGDATDESAATGGGDGPTGATSDENATGGNAVADDAGAAADARQKTKDREGKKRRERPKTI